MTHHRVKSSPPLGELVESSNLSGLTYTKGRGFRQRRTGWKSLRQQICRQLFNANAFLRGCFDD